MHKTKFPHYFLFISITLGCISQYGKKDLSSLGFFFFCKFKSFLNIKGFLNEYVNSFAYRGRPWEWRMKDNSVSWAWLQKQTEVVWSTKASFIPIQLCTAQWSEPENIQIFQYLRVLFVILKLHTHPFLYVSVDWYMDKCIFPLGYLHVFIKLSKLK